MAVNAYAFGVAAAQFRATVEGRYCAMDGHDRWDEPTADTPGAVLDSVTRLRLMVEQLRILPEAAAEQLLSAARAWVNPSSWGSAARAALRCALIDAEDTRSGAERRDADGNPVGQRWDEAVRPKKPVDQDSLDRVIFACPIVQSGWVEFEAAVRVCSAALSAPFRDLFDFGGTAGRCLFPRLEDHEPVSYALGVETDLPLTGTVKTYGPDWILTALDGGAKACGEAVRRHAPAFKPPTNLADRFGNPVGNVTNFHLEWLAALAGMELSYSPSARPDSAAGDSGEDDWDFRLAKVGKGYQVQTRGGPPRECRAGGLAYIEMLIKKAGQGTRATDLFNVSVSRKTDRPRTTTKELTANGPDDVEPGESRGFERAADSGEVTDEQGLRKLWTRLEEISEEAAQAEADNDLGTKENLSTERAQIEDAVRAATRPGGRLAKLKDGGKRISNTVSKSIKRAIQELQALNREVADYLHTTIETGTICRYKPQGKKWNFD